MFCQSWLKPHWFLSQFFNAGFHINLWFLRITSLTITNDTRFLLQTCDIKFLSTSNTYVTLPYLTLPYLTIPYLTIPYLTIHYHALPYHTYIMPCNVVHIHIFLLEPLHPSSSPGIPWGRHGASQWKLLDVAVLSAASASSLSSESCSVETPLGPGAWRTMMINS